MSKASHLERIESTYDNDYHSTFMSFVFVQLAELWHAMDHLAEKVERIEKDRRNHVVRHKYRKIPCEQHHKPRSCYRPGHGHDHD